MSDRQDSNLRLRDPKSRMLPTALLPGIYWRIEFVYEWQDSNLRKILWFPKPAFYQLNYTHISIGFFQGCRSNPSATPGRYHPDVVRELKLHARSSWVRKRESFSHQTDDLLSHTSNDHALIKLHPLLLVGATSLSMGFIWPRAQANPQDWYQSCNCRLGLAGRAGPGLVFLVSVDTCGIRTPPSPCKGEVLPLHYMAHRCPSYEGANSFMFWLFTQSFMWPWPDSNRHGFPHKSLKLARATNFATRPYIHVVSGGLEPPTCWLWARWSKTDWSTRPGLLVAGAGLEPA